MSSNEALAWAAGFFDGEGCFTTTLANTNGKRYLRCSVTQKNPELLEKMRDILGEGYIHSYAERVATSRSPRSSAGHKLQTSGRMAFRAADALWPWLGEQKKADFKRALNVIRVSRSIGMTKPQRPAHIRAEAQRLHGSGVSRSAIAAQLGIPYQTVFRWTKGVGCHREVPQ